MTASNRAEEPIDRPELLPTKLQIALWNGSLVQIRDALNEGGRDALEARDIRGNRALHLALKFSHRNAIAILKCLLEAGARVRSRDAAGWKTIHHVIAAENEDVLRILIQKEKEQTPDQLKKKLDDVCPRLAQVPNFYCEIRVDISTWIPGLSRWLPSDTVKIWKNDQDLRFDISLVGFEKGSWKRGKLTFLLLGRQGKFYCLDHEQDSCTDLLSPGKRLTSDDLDQMVHFLMTTSIVTTDFDATRIGFQKKQGWLSHSDVEQDIGRWKHTKVFDMTGVEVNLRMRAPQNKDHKSPASVVKTESSSSVNDPLTALTQVAVAPYTEVVIDAKSNHTVSVELTQGEAIRWKFSIDHCDIGFGVKFLQESNGDDWKEIVPIKRLSSSMKEQTGVFEAPADGTVVLVWDNSYSVFRQKKVRFQILPEGNNNLEFNGKDDIDSHRAKEEEMTFEDWFGVPINELPDHLRALHPKHRIMVHTQPSCRKLTKSFAATVYMSEKFPLSVNQFLPIIEVLSKTTSAFESVKEFFSAKLTDGFPVQFCFPLVPSVSATFRFDQMVLENPDESLFMIPSHYSLHHEDVLSPRTHQEMLQRVAAV